MARILGIGIATLDIINHVEGYPAEDSEVRALAQRISRGGNCTNTLVVLSQLGHRCGWGGVLAEESDAARITADLDSYHIDLAPVRRIARGKMPTSYIIVNQRNGSRTIVHYRDLPEYGYDDFAAIDLDGYHWLHLEGRHIDDSLRMLEHARARRPGVPRSAAPAPTRHRAAVRRRLAATILAGLCARARLRRSPRAISSRHANAGAARRAGAGLGGRRRLRARPRRRALPQPGLSATARGRYPGRGRHLQRRRHRRAGARPRRAGGPGARLRPRRPEVRSGRAQLFRPMHLKSPLPQQTSSPCSKSTTAAASSVWLRSRAPACAAQCSQAPNSTPPTWWKWTSPAPTSAVRACATPICDSLASRAPIWRTPTSTAPISPVPT